MDGRSVVTDTSTDPSNLAARTTIRDDWVLLERLRRNDGAALATLYDRYGGLAYGLAYRIAGDAGEAEDVVQESFLALWRQADRLDHDRGNVRSYLMTIVHRRSIDTVRKRSGKREQPLNAEAMALCDRNPEPFAFASLAEEREKVQSALAELSPDLRQAVELTYFGGLTSAELAKEADIPVGTAKSRLRRGLQRMRASLVGEPT